MFVNIWSIKDKLKQKQNNYINNLLGWNTSPEDKNVVNLIYRNDYLKKKSFRDVRQVGDFLRDLLQVGNFLHNLRQVGGFLRDLRQVGCFLRDLRQVDDFLRDLRQVGDFFRNIRQVGGFLRDLRQVGNFLRDLRQVGDFLRILPVSTTNKTDHNDITETLSKAAALNIRY